MTKAKHDKETAADDEPITVRAGVVTLDTLQGVIDGVWTDILALPAEEQRQWMAENFGDLVR